MRAVTCRGYLQVLQIFSCNAVFSTEGMPRCRTRHEEKSGNLGRLFPGDFTFLTGEEILHLLF
jgi:hypothetical protein